MKKLILLSAALFALNSNVFSICDPLPLPTTNVIEVSPGENVSSIVQNAPKGTTILLNSGTYNISSTIYMNQDSVTLMSKAQHRDSVILDGNGGGTPLDANNFVPEVVAMRGNGVTLAHVTVCHAQWHGVHAYPPSSATDNIRGIRMYDIRVYDCSEQLIKINSNGQASNLQWMDEGVLECSLVEFVDNSVMSDQGTYFYTGGIDVHGGENWIIRNNTFKNIEREAKLMEHAVHFWSKSRGTLVENNTFINVYRAIGFGMKTDETGELERHYDDGVGDNPYFDHIDGIIRNNVLYNESGVHLETGIELMNVKDVQVYNNTIFCEDDPFNSMEYRWPNTTVTVKNNVFSHNIMPRNDASGDTASNIQNASSDLFVDIANYDFHLKSTATSAIGKGVSISDSLFGLDIDGQKPNENMDIGADQVNGTAIEGALNDKAKNSSLSNFKMNNKGIEFTSDKNKSVKIELYDTKGRTVKKDKKKLTKGNSVIDLTKLPEGLYLLKIKGSDENRVLKCIWKK